VWGSNVPANNPARGDADGLNSAFDAPWARKAPARTARALLQRLLLVPVVGVLSPVRVVHRDRLGSLDRPAVFVVNHQSHLDVPVALSALGGKIRRRLVVAAAADYFYRNKAFGGAVSLALGCVPFVRRDGSSRPSLELLKRLLREGWSVLIFPSGSRSDQTSIKKGFAFLAVDTGSPVVPLHLYGLKDALPKGSWMPLPGGVLVGVGNPIDPGTDYDALVETTRRAIHELEEEIREVVAGWGEGASTEDEDS